MSSNSTALHSSASNSMHVLVACLQAVMATASAYRFLICFAVLLLGAPAGTATEGEARLASIKPLPVGHGPMPAQLGMQLGQHTSHRAGPHCLVMLTLSAAVPLKVLPHVAVLAVGAERRFVAQALQ